MKHKNTHKLALFATVVGLPVGSLHAALLVDDSFLIGSDPAAGEYNTGNVGGQNPSNLGFSGAWNNVSDDLEVVSSGLTYLNGGGTMQTVGGALKAEADGARAARPFATSFDSSTSGTYYLGFLYQQADTSAGFRGVTLYDGTPSEDNRDFMFRPDSDTAGQWNIDAFGETQDDVASSNADVNFIVLQFDMSTSAASDSLSVFLNPDLNTEPTSGAIFTAESLDIGFDRIGMERFVPSSGGNDRDIWLDEIRMSQTYTDISTVPEPMTYALFFGLATLALAGVARRRKARAGR